jgi:outer membrane protein OmpA-like peptidoglycan-associated protein
LHLPDIPLPSFSTEDATKAEPTKAAVLPNRPLRRPAPPASEPIENSDTSALSFDIVTVDPKGPSVFAGQAPPNTRVSVEANGQPIATATADDTGAWAIVTDRRLPAGETEFTLKTEEAQERVAAGPAVRMVIPPTAAPSASTPTPARLETSQRREPITFIYNDTTFTLDGWRAVDGLAKQLLSDQPAMVSLSGHADERGSDLYNIELSRKRLSVVADYLRDKGFVGKLQLIPKGKSEPYRGVDRHALSQDELFQLDRRVELIHTR